MVKTLHATRRFATAVLLTASALWILPLLLTGSWYDSDEYYRYPWLVKEFAAALQAGVIYPRWLPNINGGYGYPTFVFYQPGFFYLGAFFTLFFSDVVHACAAAIFCLYLLGGAGAYRLSRLFAGRAESLVFALIFIATPYLTYNYLARGDLTELMAIMFGPWLLRTLLELSWRVQAGKPYGKYAFTLAALMALQCYSHMFMAAPTFGVLAVLGSVLWWEQGRSPVLARVLAASLVGGVIAAVPHWAVLLQMKNEVEYSAALSDYFVTTRHVSDALRLTVEFMRVPFFISLIGFWLARRERFMQAVFALMMMCVLMTHELSRPVWAHIHVLDYLQFPWRFYGIIASLQLLGIVQLVRLRAYLSSKRFAEVLSSLLVLHLIVLEPPFVPWPSGLDFDAVRNYLPWQHEKLNNREEFNPRTMHDIGMLPDRRRTPTPIVQMSEPNTGVQIAIAFEGLPYRIAFGVKPPARLWPGGVLPDVVVNQVYFPGWKARVNGNAIGLTGSNTSPQDPVLKYDAHGRILVQLPGEGEYEVELWYDGPPHWLLRNIVVVLCLVGLVAWVRRPGVTARVFHTVQKGIFHDS